MNGELANAALEYAGRGWFVFPPIPRRKEPLTRRGFKDASCDPDTVRAWWTERPAANVGVDCGRSRLVIVDLDGPQGARAWDELCDPNSGHSATLAAVTGRGDGGTHLYFATTGTPPRSRRLALKLDTRAAGGYVVVPPSVHPSGPRYAWTNDLEPAPAPGWLLDALAPPPPAPAGERRELEPGEYATVYGRAALEGLADEMLATLEGARHDRLVRLAVRAGRIIATGELERSVARSVLVEAATLAGLPQSEAEDAFDWGCDAGELRPLVREAAR
jgi:Bifunctional DNA primase/polymerase, N-terminal